MSHCWLLAKKPSGSGQLKLTVGSCLRRLLEEPLREALPPVCGNELREPEARELVVRRRFEPKVDLPEPELEAVEAEEETVLPKLEPPARDDWLENWLEPVRRWNAERWLPPRLLKLERASDAVLPPTLELELVFREENRLLGNCACTATEKHDTMEVRSNWQDRSSSKKRWYIHIFLII